MPTTSEHIQRAENNLRFAQSFQLETTPYLDWVVTAYFYAALHLVDAILWEQDKFNPGNHSERRKCFRDKWYLKAIRDEYFALYDRSVEARYFLLTFTKPRIETAVIPLYKAIEKHIYQLLPR